MIFSVHIPKTAGTSFRRALEERYGPRLALYYGVQDPKTTEGLRVPRGELAGAVARLRDRGFEALHGHFMLRDVKPLVADPAAQVWTWLRDPVERTLSQYDFYKERPLELMKLAKAVKQGGVGAPAFARIKTVRNMQTNYLRGMALSDMAFVGLVEQFELGLALLFGSDAPELKRRYNATDVRSNVGAGQRKKIAVANVNDMQLYQDGLRLFVDRIAAAAAIAAPDRPTAAGTGAVTKLIRRASGG